ncbi:MAG: isoprenylcysteine carboxylmethyltransferase family protein [Verrucomicrobia bacterium]|nr:MAG: isoprenylcysteine carboxylmethyltransferase family protein [Verrucomicrobiota bacterium]
MIMMTTFSSRVLVATQLGLLVALAIPGADLHFSPLGAGFLLPGVALGFWAAAMIGIRRVRIMPEPGANLPLVRRGPYRWIRHPMYTAVTLATLGWLLCNFSWPRLACWLALLPVLILKAAREERLLAAQHPDYRAYQATSWRFIPWVW